MIFPELSNAALGFVLRCAGAEIDGGGGGVQTPPIRWWKIQRPIRAQVKVLGQPVTSEVRSLTQK